MKFKTNLKCDGCVRAIRPNLDNIKEIREWSVDLKSPGRILTIKGDGLDASKIISALKAAGYIAERID
jgi:copper chaperone CopZ